MSDNSSQEACIILRKEPIPEDDDSSSEGQVPTPKEVIQPGSQKETHMQLRKSRKIVLNDTPLKLEEEKVQKNVSEVSIQKLDLKQKKLMNLDDSVSGSSSDEDLKGNAIADKSLFNLEEPSQPPVRQSF